MTTTTDLGELTGDYVLDTARTRIGFAARAALVIKVRGRFDAFEGSARLNGDDPAASVVRLVIRADSLRTGNRKRDDHLRGGDFLDVGSHPVITFTSTGVTPAGGTRFTVTGDLTVHGVTRPVGVDVRLTGVRPGPQGGFRAGFHGRATVHRKDWGVGPGGALVGDKVTLEFDVVVLRH
ncbi:YceI family protein [Streptomyces sp.]|uniref:YceI family protein n=1 Tax=Streptomyces sp. TaxID=1931 RepID=UPI002D3DCFD4|nr:YceI family protein [Streptomyces sp.]HZF89146.1 YceI family protein [Streptomyces sp.]